MFNFNWQEHFMVFPYHGNSFFRLIMARLNIFIRVAICLTFSLHCIALKNTRNGKEHEISYVREVSGDAKDVVQLTGKFVNVTVGNGTLSKNNRLKIKEDQGKPNNETSRIRRDIESYSEKAAATKGSATVNFTEMLVNGTVIDGTLYKNNTLRIKGLETQANANNASTNRNRRHIAHDSDKTEAAKGDGKDEVQFVEHFMNGTVVNGTLTKNNKLKAKVTENQETGNSQAYRKRRDMAPDSQKLGSATANGKEEVQFTEQFANNTVINGTLSKNHTASEKRKMYNNATKLRKRRDNVQQNKGDDGNDRVQFTLQFVNGSVVNGTLGRNKQLQLHVSEKHFRANHSMEIRTQRDISREEYYSVTKSISTKTTTRRSINVSQSGSGEYKNNSAYDKDQAHSNKIPHMSITAVRKSTSLSQRVSGSLVSDVGTKKTQPTQAVREITNKNVSSTLPMLKTSKITLKPLPHSLESSQKEDMSTLIKTKSTEEEAAWTQPTPTLGNDQVETSPIPPTTETEQIETASTLPTLLPDTTETAASKSILLTPKTTYTDTLWTLPTLSETGEKKAKPTLLKAESRMMDTMWTPPEAASLPVLPQTGEKSAKSTLLKSETRNTNTKWTPPEVPAQPTLSETGEKEAKSALLKPETRNTEPTSILPEVTTLFPTISETSEKEAKSTSWFMHGSRNTGATSIIPEVSTLPTLLETSENEAMLTLTPETGNTETMSLLPEVSTLPTLPETSEKEAMSTSFTPETTNTEVLSILPEVSTLFPTVPETNENETQSLWFIPKSRNTEITSILPEASTLFSTEPETSENEAQSPTHTPESRKTKSTPMLPGISPSLKLSVLAKNKETVAKPTSKKAETGKARTKSMLATPETHQPDATSTQLTNQKGANSTQVRSKVGQKETKTTLYAYIPYEREGRMGPIMPVITRGAKSTKATTQINGKSVYTSTTSKVGQKDGISTSAATQITRRISSTSTASKLGEKEAKYTSSHKYSRYSTRPTSPLPKIGDREMKLRQVNVSLISGVMWGDVWRSPGIGWVAKVLNGKQAKPSDRQFFHEYLPDVLLLLNETCVRFVERDERDYTVLQHVSWKDPEQNVRYPTVPAPCRFGRSNGFLCVLVDDGESCYYSSGWAQDRVQAIVEGRLSNCSRRRRLQLVTHALGLMQEHDRGDALRHVHLHPRLRVLTGNEDLIDYRIAQNSCDIVRQNKSKLPFDFNSIVLHDHAFAPESELMDYDLPLIPRDFGNMQKMMAYRRTALSHFDKLKLRELYKCRNKSCKIKQSCENFGFRNRNCQCECAPGFKGDYCEKKKSIKRNNCTKKVTKPVSFFLNETICSETNQTFNYSIDMTAQQDQRFVVKITMTSVHTLLHGLRILPDCSHARLYFTGSGVAWPRKYCAGTLLRGPLTLRSSGSAAVLVLVLDLPMPPEHPAQLDAGLPSPQQAIGDVYIEILTENNPASDLVVDTSRNKPARRRRTTTTPVSIDTTDSPLTPFVQFTRKVQKLYTEPQAHEARNSEIPKPEIVGGDAPLASRSANPSKGSKTGIIVAIVIVVLLLVLIIAGVAFCIYRNRMAAADEMSGEGEEGIDNKDYASSGTQAQADDAE